MASSDLPDENNPTATIMGKAPPTAVATIVTSLKNWDPMCGGLVLYLWNNLLRRAQTGCPSLPTGGAGGFGIFGAIPITCSSSLPVTYSAMMLL